MTTHANPAHGRQHRSRGGEDHHGEIVPIGASLEPETQLPEVTGGDPGLGGLIAELCAGVTRAYEAAMAADTRRSYAEGWADFVGFADANGLPHLPETPDDTRHLGTIALWAVWSLEQRPVLGYAPAGVERPVEKIGLAWSTVSTRLAGIVNGFAERGVPSPSRHPALKRVLEGLRRQYDCEPRQATPLTTTKVRRVVDATHSVSPRVLRDGALVVLVHNGVHQRGLERLRWDELVVLEDRWVFGTGSRAICLVGRPEDAELCPLQALAGWRAGGLGGAVAGPVFPLLDRDGHVKRDASGVTPASTHQALAKTVRWRANQAGLQTRAGAGMPDLRDERTTRAVLAAMELTDLIGLRDRALVLLGFVVASRRRNLSEFDVGDLTLSDRGMLVTFRRSKTDPYGRSPRKVDVKRLDDGRYDPVAAVEAWLDAYAKALGRPLVPGDPLFPRINRHGRIATVEELNPSGAHGNVTSLHRGTVPSRLSRPAISAVTKSRAAKAGLSGRYSSHCLRRGLGTSLAEAKVPIQDIARRGGWTSLNTVAVYIEDAEHFEQDIAQMLGLGEEPR